MTTTLRRLAPLWAVLHAAGVRTWRVTPPALRGAHAWLYRSRDVLLSVNGFAFGVAFFWVTFGLGAGLGAVAVSSFALEVLSRK